MDAQDKLLTDTMEWEATHLGPTMCNLCNMNAFDPFSLLPQHLSDSAANIFPIVFSCGHLFHVTCLKGNQKCPLDCYDVDPLPPPSVASPENSSTGNFNILRRAGGFPSTFLGEDDFILQYTLAYYDKVTGPLAPRVLSAHIVNNASLKEKFDNTKKSFGHSLLLFHGTPYANISSIVATNFNINAKVSNGRAHGNGVYFSDR